jgi:hypothetical protein
LKEAFLIGFAEGEFEKFGDLLMTCLEIEGVLQSEREIE